MARWYNSNIRRHRMKEMKEYAEMVAQNLTTGGTVLEVAPGPGYLAIELAKLGPYRVEGLELSRTFVDIARSNAKAAGVEVNFQQGNVSDIPFPADSYDSIVCTAAFKNFKDPVRALTEMYRVLKPGGSVLIVDMNRQATDRQIDCQTQKMEAKGVEALFLKLTFKYFLRSGAYTKEEFAGLLSSTGWATYYIEEQGIGFNIWLRK